jgi:hypothetical protein
MLTSVNAICDMTTLIVDDRKMFSSPEIILSNILKELDFLQKVKKSIRKLNSFKFRGKMVCKKNRETERDIQTDTQTREKDI